MKIQSILTVLTSVYLLCVTSAAAQEQPEPIKGRLLYSNGSHDDVFIISYKAGIATYRTSLRSLNILQAKKPALEAIYFYEPKIFTEAMSLYWAKNYSEAKVKFAECEVSYKPVNSLPDNYATLAGFYKMECSRSSGDLEALSAELEKYRKDGLTRENHHQQLEIYTFWEAIRLKEWARIDRLAMGHSWQGRKLPSELRVQIEYCHALALDELTKEDASRWQETINAYNRVLSADATASIDLVLKAANNLMRMYAEDADVQKAMKNWKAGANKTVSAGDQKLMEANTLAQFYKQVGFHEIQPLSTDYQDFLKYGQVKFDAEAAKKPDAAAKPDVDKSTEEPEAAGDDSKNSETKKGGRKDRKSKGAAKQAE
jgi:hypothetical protein